MGVALAGLMMMAMPIALASWAGRHLRREGRSIHPAVRYLARSWMVWFGLALVAMSISRPAGALMVGVLFAKAVVDIVILLLKVPGVVRRLPATYRNIGDPAAWRGGS